MIGQNATEIDDRPPLWPLFLVMFGVIVFLMVVLYVNGGTP